MRTNIDKAGRLVIPRVLRERISLTDGGEEDGFLIIPRTGNSVTDEMVREVIDADRHRR